MLEKVKILLELTDNSKDNLLTVLIDSAIDEAISFTHQDNIDELETTIIKMVIYNYNRLGTEGIESEGYSGVSYSYSADYPDAIIRSLRSKRKLRTI